MRELIQAEQALGDYTRKHARHIIAGELGNNAGTVDHPTRLNFVYVKLHGDDNQVVEAEAVASFPHQAGIIVAVELVKRNAASRYQVLGIASNIMFVGSIWAGTVGEHAEQHQRRDLGEGGFDPLDIYNRALVNLRGRAQATPDFTLYVERGFYFIGGALYEWTGGNSAAFTVPAGSFGVTVRRCDLLYIGSDQALHIVQGATTSDGSVPAYPTTPYPCIPIAYVYLTSSSTSIQEDNIKDARVILTASDGTPVAHNLLSATHGDTLAAAVVAGDIIIGNDTPKWSRLAITVPAANVRNVVGVDNGETKPSWKVALDGTTPADIAGTAAAGTSLVFAHRDHVHRGVLSINKAADTTLYGAVTLSEGANITLTQVGQDISIAAAAGGGAHTILSATHTDTLADTVVDGDVIIGNATPKWSRLAISIPAAGTLNYLGVNNGELRPSWKSASSNPGAAESILASNAGGGLGLVQLFATVSVSVTDPSHDGILMSLGPVAVAPHDIYLISGSLTADRTVTFGDVAGTVALGAGTATVSSTNSVTVANHTHAVTSSSNPGAAAALLATNASGIVQLTGLGVGVAPGYTVEVAGTLAVRFANPDVTGMYFQATTGTNAVAFKLTNTGNSFFGRDNSTSGRISGSGNAYDTCMWVESNTNFVIGTNNAVRVTVANDGGVVVGAATGGTKGAGTINTAGDIYKNNSAYANPAYALEHWAEGSIITHADKPGAQDYRRLTLGEVEDYVRRHYELPGHRDSFGLFDGGDWMLEKVEELATYVIELHHRLEKLERGH